MARAARAAFDEDDRIAAFFERALEEVHGWRADKGGDEAVLRIAIDIERRTGLLDQTVAHDDDAVAERHGFFLIVRYIDGRGLEALVERFEFGTRRDAELGVEIGERFVEEKGLGFADDGATERDTLALAAGELAGLAVEHVGETESFGDTLDAPIDLGLGDFSELEREGHVLVDAHVGVEGVGLEDHRDVTVLRMNVVDDAIADGDRAGGDILKTGDHAERGGFAAARRADEHDEFAVLDFEIEVFDGVETVGIGLVNGIQRDEGHRRED